MVGAAMSKTHSGSDRRLIQASGERHKRESVRGRSESLKGLTPRVKVSLMPFTLRGIFINLAGIRNDT